MYDYREETAENIRQYLEENWENIPEENLTDPEELQEYLQDELRTEDSITGNGSGSYTFNSAQAKENLEGNEELLEEVINEFSIDMGKHRNDYEYLDVSIRCYILSECINRVIEDCTRTCDNCGKVFIEGYCIHEGEGYYCSDDCLKAETTEEEIKALDIGTDNSDSYRTTRIESL